MRNPTTNALTAGQTPKRGKKQNTALHTPPVQSHYGITKGLSDEVLGRLLGRRSGPETTCQELLSAATEADGSDNMTAVVVDVTG